jgi:hypothetical protein
LLPSGSLWALTLRPRNGERIVAPPTTVSCVGCGAGIWALEALGTAKAVPTIAVVRISFGFTVAPPRPRSVVAHGLSGRTPGALVDL